MRYRVSLIEVDVTWAFTESFSREDRDAFLEANVGVTFLIDRGEAFINSRGEILISLTTNGSAVNHRVDYQELRRQLLNPQDFKVVSRY